MVAGTVSSLRRVTSFFLSPLSVLAAVPNRSGQFYTTTNSSVLVVDAPNNESRRLTGRDNFTLAIPQELVLLNVDTLLIADKGYQSLAVMDLRESVTSFICTGT